MKNPGVYVLYSGEIPVYVGSSIRMRERVKFHNHRGKFDRVEYHSFSEDELALREQEFIDDLRPTLNIHMACRNRARVYDTALMIYIKHRSTLAGGMEELATRTGVSRPSLYRISTGDENVTLRVLRKLGVGLSFPKLPKIPQDIETK